MTEANGFKHVGLLTKHAEQSFEEFVDYWLKVHSEPAVPIPGLHKYTVNPIDRRLYPDSPIEGFSELWFDSLEAAQAPFESEAAKKTFVDVPNFAANVAATYITELQKV